MVVKEEAAAEAATAHPWIRMVVMADGPGPEEKEARVAEVFIAEIRIPAATAPIMVLRVKSVKTEKPVADRAVALQIMAVPITVPAIWPWCSSAEVAAAERAETAVMALEVVAEEVV
jgi:hypothetical protein